MNRCWIRSCVTAFGFFAFFSASYRPSALAAEKSVFTGVWERNEKESDDAKEKMKAAFEKMGGRAGRGMPGRPGGPPGPGMGPPPPGAAGGMAGLTEAAEQIETSLKGDEFQVSTADSSRVSIFYLDGKTHMRETPGGAKIETRSERRGDAIVIEQKTDLGAKITTTYRPTPDGTRMIVTLRFEGRIKDPVVIRTVYDAIPE